MSSALVFGTGIHTAIEDFYRAELAGEEKPDVEQLMFAYQSAWLPHDPEAIASVKANVTAIGRIQPDQLRRLLLVIRPTRPMLAEVPLAELSARLH